MQERLVPTRRPRILFFAVMAVIILCLVWPGYTLFSSATPLILGFPLSFAWIIFCTFVEFVALTGLYVSDRRHEEDE